MKKMLLKDQETAKGGFYWKCQSSYHSSWANNTFVSSFHGFWSTANSRRAEHVRSYSHATDQNTWVTAYN